MSLIKLDHICFAYGGEEVLHDINLEIQSGEFWGIIGPNGSGKTTLLKIILGLLKPSAGAVYLFDQPLKNFSAWSQIGFVPQSAGTVNINFPITVAEIVGLGAGHPTPKDIASALQSVDLSSFGDRLVNQLSGGQKQRVFIARALVSHPQLLILDEPTVSVDAASQDQFYKLLTDLNSHHHISIVLVSHDSDIIKHTTGKILNLYA